MSMSKPERTTFLLITCSRDESRRDLAVAVTKNLVARLSELNLTERLIVFDNASIYQEHLQFLPDGVQLCLSKENLGYWTAIKWVLDNLSKVTSVPSDFLYLVESDLVHSDLSALGKCELFLDQEQSASVVRTQEFSVSQRWRFNKRLSFLPFHVERSQVALKNAVTNEKATFDRARELPGLYLSNLHPKLPALQRVELLSSVFDALASKSSFIEADYFAEAMKLRPKIGVLDGGLFHSLASWSDRGNVISGSYASAERLKKVGYHPTRACKITSVGRNQVDIRVLGD